MKNNNNDRTDILSVQYDQALAFLEKLLEYVDDIDAILRDVANHYDADRAYVFELSEDGNTIDNTYEWCKSGVIPQIEFLQNLPYESVEVWFEEFERQGAFAISSLDKDVDNSSLTYEILEPQGIESLITAPIYKGNKIIGFIGVDNPQSNTKDIIVLKTTASILYSEIRKRIANKNKAIKEMTETQLEKDAKLVEIKDIIASANMGIWRIELIEGKEPCMYVDDTMKQLLGIEGRDDSPEDIYKEWFDNITKEALQSVLDSVQLMKDGHFDENTYLWNHPELGARYVRCGGSSKKTDGGYILQGYHYDVDELVRREQAQMYKLEKAINDKKEYYDTLGALGDIFYSMHVVDLTKDSVVQFNSKNEVKRIEEENKGGASDLMKQIMDTVIKDDFKEAVMEFTNLSTLAERMRNKKFISREFVGKNIGWFLANFITMDTDEEGRPTKVIFATRVIDEEKKQEEKLIYKTQTDEMTGLLNRRAYEENIYAHNDLPQEDKFIYLSIDANGLKQVNDTLGHAAGDELLIGVSQCMEKSMGSVGHLYRIGGDEFVAILFCDNKEINSVLRDFDEAVANWKGSLVDSISVSYGFIDKHEMPNASTRQLGAIAESRMYDAKSEYYRKQGVDRRGQLDAHKTLCELYTKILRINISDDSYQIISMDTSEQTAEKGFSNKISEWLASFGKTGQVHPDDLTEYLKLTDLQYMKDYFANGKTSLHIFYRRKYEEDFKLVMMEIVPANDFSEDNFSLFLYVKAIDK